MTTQGETLIDELADAAFKEGRYADSVIGLKTTEYQEARNKAHEALTAYMKALKAKPTVYRSAETVEVGPPDPDAAIMEEGFSGSEIEYDQRVKELRELGTKPRPAATGVEHLRAAATTPKLSTLPLRIVDIVAKVDPAKVNNGDISVYVELVTGERLRLIGIGRHWLRVLTSGGQVREKVSAGEVVQVIV